MATLHWPRKCPLIVEFMPVVNDSRGGIEPEPPKSGPSAFGQIQPSRNAPIADVLNSGEVVESRHSGQRNCIIIVPSRRADVQKELCTAGD